jgi:hypothetical protein
MGQKWVSSIHKEGINKRVVGWLQIQKPSIGRRAEVQQRVYWGDWQGSEMGKQNKFLSSEFWASLDYEWKGGVGSLNTWSGYRLLIWVRSR